MGGGSHPEDQSPSMAAEQAAATAQAAPPPQPQPAAAGPAAAVAGVSPVSGGGSSGAAEAKAASGGVQTGMAAAVPATPPLPDGLVPSDSEMHPLLGDWWRWAPGLTQGGGAAQPAAAAAGGGAAGGLLSWFTACMPPPPNVLAVQQSFVEFRYRSWGLAPRLVQLDDETSMHVWAPAPSGGPMAKPARATLQGSLLLLHGFGPAALWQWSYQVPALAPYFDLYIPDLVFFGRSTSTSEERTLKFQAKCVALMMEKLGVPKYDVVGLSYGGFVAYWLALFGPERVGRLVLTDSPPLVMETADYDLMCETHKVADAEELLLPKDPAGVRKLLSVAYLTSMPMPDWVLFQTLQFMFMDMVEEKRGLLQHLKSYLNHPPPKNKISQDTLVIWGEGDKVFPVELAQRLESVVERPRVEVIRNTAHMPNGERPAEYNRLLLDFLLLKDKKGGAVAAATGPRLSLPRFNFSR